jgi:chemotaxis protein methyltransferase CheR
MTLRTEPALPDRFRQFVAARFGLAFDDGKLAFLGEILRRRADANRVPAETYLALIENGVSAEESGSLAEELTVGETYFFRNSDQFRALTEHAIPARMHARAGTRRLNFLSAGCATGEEPYSIAMTVAEIVPASWVASIRAVDINPAALARAKAGMFSSWSLRETPLAVQQKWFRPESRHMLLDDRIKAAVAFSQGNLASDESDLWAPEAYDIIFCRNVIMYFAPAVQEAVIARIARSLAPGGFLFLGHAETLRGLSQRFHLMHTHETFYYQRKDAEEEHRPPPVSRPAPQAGRIPPEVVAGEIDIGWYESIGSATRKIRALSAAPVAAEAGPIAAAMSWNLGSTIDLMRRERYGDALKAIDGMPSAAHADPDVLLLRAILLLQHGQLEAAEAASRELLARDEMSAGANYVLALCCEAARDRAAAVHHFRVAAYLDNTFAMPRLHLGLMARKAGDRRGAVAELKEALGLLRREEASRILMFGGGFTRDGLLAFCETELRAAGGKP